MRKIAFILIAGIVNCGCAVNKKNTRSTSSDITEAKPNTLYESILDQNLTGRSFYIERAEFKIKSGIGEKSGLGTIKFLMPDKFLISIKSPAGIEVARIFLTGDSIMVNDRFNKRLYCGSTSYLKTKYGVTTALLPVLLGDYVNDQKLDSNTISCSDGKLTVMGIVNNVKVKYLIDCELAKSILTIPEQTEGESFLEINYSKFFRAGDINCPGKVEIIERKSNTTIEILIQKYTSPWSGAINFIPGKQYDKIHLQ